jgi:hypothetical protein
MFGPAASAGVNVGSSPVNSFEIIAVDSADFYKVETKNTIRIRWCGLERREKK